MQCIKCKKELPEGAVYCLYCGKKQVSAAKRKRHAKRSRGSGTICKLSGKRAKPFQAFFPAYWDENGRAVRKVLGTYATYEEADAALRKALEIGREAHETTLETIYNRFTASHYFLALSESGQESHRKAYKYMEGIRNTPVVQLSTTVFQGVVDDMQRRGLSRETMAKVRNLASLLCKECMRGKMMNVNFGQLVQLPREEKAQQRSFSLRELARVWDRAEEGDRTAMTVILLCYTGMRPSELLGVKIEEHLRQRNQWTYIQTGSKTEAGRNRIIPVPDVALPFLEKLKAGRDFGFLVPTETGVKWREDNWRKRRFYPLMEQLKIRQITPYACRHTFSNLQKRRNIDPEIMMEVMGHTDYSTTVEHYHTTTEDDIDRICGAISGLESPKVAG